MRFTTIVVASALSIAIGAAQEPPPPPPFPPPPPGVSAAGFPGMRYIAHEFSFDGKQVPGAPYSAEEVTESVQTLADGNRIVNKSTAKIARDSQGRVRREVTLPFPGPNEQVHTMVTIYDPVAGVSYFLNAENKTATKTPAGPRTSQGMETRRVFTQSGKGEAGHQVFFERFDKRDAKREDLGTQDVDGVAAQGTRETTTIPAGAMGNEQPLVITSERWYSPDLQIELKSVHKDPRTGQTTFSVSNLNRAEPDPSLFQVPAGYTVTDQPGPNVIYRTKRP